MVTISKCILQYQLHCLPVLFPTRAFLDTWPFSIKTYLLSYNFCRSMSEYSSGANNEVEENCVCLSQNLRWLWGNYRFEFLATLFFLLSLKCPKYGIIIHWTYLQFTHSLHNDIGQCMLSWQNSFFKVFCYHLVACICHCLRQCCGIIKK